MLEQFLSETSLFAGISPDEITLLLQHLGAVQKHFAKGEMIYLAGLPIRSMGLVLAGRVQIENDDPWGNKNVLDSVEPGFVFAETYACIPDEPMMVSVIAAQASEILFLEIGRLLASCPNACTPHSRLIQNLLGISAQKNLALSRRIFHTSSKSIRGRLLSYLSFQSARCASRSFTIPFNRQQLADYLSVDRSALSNELSKMQQDGLLEVKKSHFVLK